MHRKTLKKRGSSSKGSLRKGPHEQRILLGGSSRDGPFFLLDRGSYNSNPSVRANFVKRFPPNCRRRHIFRVDVVGAPGCAASMRRQHCTKFIILFCSIALFLNNIPINQTDATTAVDALQHHRRGLRSRGVTGVRHSLGGRITTLAPFPPPRDPPPGRRCGRR